VLWDDCCLKSSRHTEKSELVMLVCVYVMQFWLHSREKTGNASGVEQAG
jgi:hypothetical protein